MGLLKGTMTYQRFFLEEILAISPDEIAEKLNLFRFKPLHARGHGTESFGWVGFQNEYNAKNKIEIKDYLYDDRVVLSLRIDKLILPRELLKSNIKAAVLDYMKEQGKNITKVVKKEIEQAEAQALRERVLPKTKIISGVWDLKTGEIRIFGRSAVQVDCFVSLFASSFLVKPLLGDFSRLAVGFAEKNSALSLLESLNYRPLFVSGYISENI